MSKKKTHKQFVEELKGVNARIEVLGEYETAHKKIQVKCLVCGNVWDVKPCSLLVGRGCPSCGKKKIGKALKKSNDSFIHELENVNPNVLALEKYRGSREKILFKCKVCGNEWKTTSSSLLSGHGCPKCGYERQKKKQRITNEDFAFHLKEVNSSVVALDEYINNHKKIRFRCNKCGNIWTTTPYSVLAGHGCPQCARSSTSFLEKVILYYFKELLGDNEVLSRDRSLIGMELDIVVPSLRVAFEPGSWKWHSTKKKRDQEKRKRCKEKGYRLIFIYTEYKNDRLPFEEDCHVFEASLGNSNWIETKSCVVNILQEFGVNPNNNQWEIIRKKAIESSRRKTHEEYVSELLSINPDIKVIGNYVDSSTKIEHECLKCKNKWDAIPSSVLMGHGCPICAKRRSGKQKRKTHEQFIVELNKKNPRVKVLGEYTNNKKKLLCECLDCGNVWNITPQSLLKGCGCPQCGRKRVANKLRKTHEEFVEELRVSNPSLNVIGEYVDSSIKVKIECDICKYVWLALPSTILSGHGCPKCGGSLKKTNEQFLIELNQKLPNVIPLEPYSSANNKINVRCKKCGYEWLIRPHDLLRSKGCKMCRKKNVENLN